MTEQQVRIFISSDGQAQLEVALDQDNSLAQPSPAGGAFGHQAPCYH